MDNPAEQTSHRRLAKKPRKSKARASGVLPTSTRTFLGLPFELFAEVLVYTASPKDVLAVARCNKYLCTTLLQQNSKYIWRAVRKNCVPGPLPDPLPMGLTESAFAALVFDQGPCSSCGKISSAMYASWSLRVRFCSQVDCRSSWVKEHVKRITNFDILDRHTRKALEWIPLAESPACFWQAEDPLKVWPGADKVYLASSMRAALDEYGAANSNVVDTRHKTDKDRAVQKMSFYVELYTWKVKRQELQRTIKEQNEAFTKALASKEGYDFHALAGASETYNAIYRHRNKNLELITDQDYNVVSAQIEAELIAVQDRGERRTNESSTAANGDEIKRHYDRLVSLNLHSKSAPLPSLSVFRTLPIVALLQKPSVPPGTKKKNKIPGVGQVLEGEDSLIKHILSRDLGGWRKSVEAGLSVTLGIPEWKTARNNRLHPLARVTARWTCSKCGKVARGYRWDECLDFEGVCQHECRKGKESSWRAEQFVKDDKAINAMMKVVELCGIDAESPESFKALDAIGPRILCQSCPGAIVMRPSNVVGHCHRHDTMKMSLLSQTDADALIVAPVEKGLAKKLIEGYDEPKIRRLHETWEFGCRHCLQPQRHPAPPPAAKEKDNAPQAEALPVAVADATGHQAEEAEAGPADTERQAKAEPAPVKKPNIEPKQPRKFKLNGLRSHLKEKHLIELPHDEDLYHILEKVDANTKCIIL